MGPAASTYNTLGSSGFLLTSGAGRTTAEYTRGSIIYAQGDYASTVFLVQEGRVVLNVVSPCGKEAIVGMAGPGEFFGEGCIFEEDRRASSAVALERSLLLRFEKQDLKYVLRHSSDFCETFLHRIVQQKKELEEALADQLFSSSERRLARILLVLSRDAAGTELTSIPRLSQTTLAAMVGTTRSRISYFLGQFRKLGLIASTPEIRVNRARMAAMLRS